MTASAAKYTSVYFWLFALLRFGFAQENVSNNSRMGGVPFPTQGLPLPLRIANVHRRIIQSATEAKSSCLAPPQPANGEWKLDRLLCDNIEDCTIPEGTALEPGSQIIYGCDRGYRLEGSAYAYCRATEKWSPIPSCTEVKCKTLNSASTSVFCTRFGKWVNCDSPVYPETRAELTCRAGYKKDTSSVLAQRKSVHCNVDGNWEPHPIKCVPICGLATTNQTPFVVNGMRANIAEFPWHASLFVQINTQRESRKEFICGATVIQTNLVLTAAHCVYDERTKTTQDPGKLFVITGNIFRDYDSPVHDPNIVRKASVKNVYKYCNYYGLTGNYASDIALLELEQSFQFSSILLPACLDDSGYSDQILEPGAYGKVAGFGRTATGTTSGILQTITVPYISYSQCKASNNGARNEAFISNDKFCAGYNNGSAVCEGDSGGGLMFRKGDLWYVMGIVSVGLGVDTNDGEKTCDHYSYSLYTKVSIYMSWIQDVLYYVQRNQSLPSCSGDS